MDSYYLTRDGAKWLHENKVMYVGSIKKNRVFSLCSVLEPHLVKSGTSKIAYNRSTGESLTYVWSENPKLGKKNVHSNGYKLLKKPKKDTSFATYDDYKAGFGGCDRFNKLLANKNWPYVVKSDRQASSNYIFSCLVLNAYFLFLDINQENPENFNMTYSSFCADLAKEIVLKHKR